MAPAVCTCSYLSRSLPLHQSGVQTHAMDCAATFKASLCAGDENAAPLVRQQSQEKAADYVQASLQNQPFGSFMANQGPSASMVESSGSAAFPGAPKQEQRHQLDTADDCASDCVSVNIHHGVPGKTRQPRAPKPRWNDSARHGSSIPGKRGSSTGEAGTAAHTVEVSEHRTQPNDMSK